MAHLALDVDDSRSLEHGLSATYVTKATKYIGEKSYTWKARPYRRNRPQGPEAEAIPDLHTFSIFDSSRIKHATSNPGKALSFLVGPTVFLGSLLFVIGAAAQLDVTYWQGKWPEGQELALVDGPYLAGAVFFLVGAGIAFVEAANTGFSEAWAAWQRHSHSRSRGGGAPDPAVARPLRPHLTLARWPTHLDRNLLSVPGTFLQFAGSVVFVIGTATELAQTTDPDMRASIERWLLDFQYLLGGVLFTAGAYLLAAEGSHSWWRGLLPPLRREDLRSVDHWAEFFNWAGSLLFLLGGASEWRSGGWSPHKFVAVTAATWLVGSLVFLAQGTLLYLETVNPAL